MIKIETASYKTHSKAELDELYRIVIRGYELTESEIWGDNYIRIFRPEYDLLIEKGEVLLAKCNGFVVGGIHCYQISKLDFTFSLLATDFDYGGKGIGTALIHKVEEIALAKGLESIKMEVLRVKGVNTPSKLRLDSFYRRLGYHYTHSEDCSCKIPSIKYAKLKAQSDFDFYKKVL
ncbi:MAG: GNAT family N-acetyltransferase [Crocinitomicaceae bacterium]